MAIVSVTRLRLRGWWLGPIFLRRAMGVTAQVRAAPGFLGGALLPEGLRTYWTLTVWDGPESLRAFMTGGAHGAVMGKLALWCDEASVVRWQQEGARLPDWPLAYERMRRDGRPSPLRDPSVRQACTPHGLDIDPPAYSRSVPLMPL